MNQKTWQRSCKIYCCVRNETLLGVICWHSKRSVNPGRLLTPVCYCNYFYFSALPASCQKYFGPCWVPNGNCLERLEPFLQVVLPSVVQPSLSVLTATNAAYFLDWNCYSKCYKQVIAGSHRLQVVCLV